MSPLAIVLLGGNGQLGAELRRTLSIHGDLTTTVRRPGQWDMPGVSDDKVLDLADFNAVRTFIEQRRPTLIVNAAAYTAVDRAESDPFTAQRLNAELPAVLASVARDVRAAIIHYSTDYVYDGRGTRPWRETDTTWPLNVYGRTKLAGDQALLASGVPHVTLRTSWVYGEQGGNFVKTMLRLGSERTSMRVVADQYGAPTSARLLADVTGAIVAGARGDFCGYLSPGGVVHVSGGGETTWHGFATQIFEIGRNLGVPLKVEGVEPITTKDFPTPAVRPLNSRLDLNLLADRFRLSPPDWRTTLALEMPMLVRALA